MIYIKVLFISDIHGLDTNLHVIDEEIIDKKIDKLVVLGDLFSGSNRNNIINFLNKYKDIIVCMKGNCDSFYDFNELEFPVYDDISCINVDDIKIYITHGNLYNVDKRNDFNGRILVYGHKHIPYIIEDNNQVFICVGSISYPRDEKGCSYVIYENREFLIYDLDKNVIDGVKV